MRIDAHQHFWRYAADEFICIDDSMSCLRQEFLPEYLELFVDRKQLVTSNAIR